HGARPRHPWRYRQYALRRWHLGLARRRDWRRGGAAGGENPAQEHPGRCCRDPAIGASRARYRRQYRRTYQRRCAGERIQGVDEQIRGGVVQGLGAALFEKCIYDERGQLTNANMADYLVPMSGEMPDIDVGHVVSPTLESELGAKGAGEAGTAGAAAAVANAV